MIAAQIREFLVQILVKKGMYAFEAEIVADRLLDAEALQRPEAGCASLPGFIRAMDMGDVDPRAIPLKKSESPAVSFVNGNEGMGHVSATKGMETAITKARELGVGLTVVSNSQRLGCPLVYARLAALSGLIGICLTSTADQLAEAVPTAAPGWLGRQPSAYAVPLGDKTLGYELAFAGTGPGDITLPGELSAPLGLLHAVLTCGLTGERMPNEKTRGPHLERTEHFLFAIDARFFAGPEKLAQKITALESHFQQSGVPLTSYLLTAESQFELSESTRTELQQIGEKLRLTPPW